MNFYDYIPQKKAESQENDGIYTIIHYNNKVFDKIAQILFSKPKITKITLDKYGSFIWKMIDGKKNVYDIATEFQKHFDYGSYEKTAEFIMILNKNDFLDLVTNNLQIDFK